MLNFSAKNKQILTMSDASRIWLNTAEVGANSPPMPCGNIVGCPICGRGGEEVWKPVPGWASYMVSNFGRVRRHYDTESANYRLLHPYPHSKGYVRVSLKEQGRKEIKRTVHVLVMRAFIGPPIGDQTVNHKDTNKTHNCLLNLEYLSRGDNVIQGFRDGMYPTDNRRTLPTPTGVPT